MENRDVTFDMIKGIGMLLMLIGHYIPNVDWLHQIIYSFHMPLFFIVAGYFSKPPQNGCLQSIKKNARRLLLPFVITQILLIAWGCVLAYFKHDLNRIIVPSLSLMWGGSDVIKSQWGLIYIGPMWFLPAMFWSKSIFEIMLSKTTGWKLLIASVIVSVISILLHNYVKSPWGIIQGLSCLTFMVVGYSIKQQMFPKWFYWIALACWPIAILFSKIEVADCNYYMYPLDVLGACGGTFACWWVANRTKNFHATSIPLAWFGINSLAILCFHDFEWFSAIAYSISSRIPIDMQNSTIILLRFSLTILYVYLALAFPYGRIVYGTKK